MYIDTTLTDSIAPTVALYASLLLSVLSLCGNAVQYFAGKRARDAEAKAKEAEADKTESDRKSVDVSTLNTLLKTVNEQVLQVVEMRRIHEAERLRDHDELVLLRIGLGECQEAHEVSERERSRLDHELKDTAALLKETTDRLNQLEAIIQATQGKDVTNVP